MLSNFELLRDMKKLLIVLFITAGCGGKLSDEQRQRLKEGMSTQDIKRVTEADLQAAAMTYGHEVVAVVEKTDATLMNKSKIDSLSKTFHVKIYSLVPSDAALRDIEKQLMDAYVSGGGINNVGDNLQKMGEDSLLYTKPVFKERPDGSLEFSHAIGVKMPVKTIVLSMPKP